MWPFFRWTWRNSSSDAHCHSGVLLVFTCTQQLLVRTFMHNLVWHTYKEEKYLITCHHHAVMRINCSNFFTSFSNAATIILCRCRLNIVSTRLPTPKQKLCLSEKVKKGEEHSSGQQKAAQRPHRHLQVKKNNYYAVHEKLVHLRWWFINRAMCRLHELCMGIFFNVCVWMIMDLCARVQLVINIFFIFIPQEAFLYHHSFMSRWLPVLPPLPGTTPPLRQAHIHTLKALP